MLKSAPALHITVQAEVEILAAAIFINLYFQRSVRRKVSEVMRIGKRKEIVIIIVLRMYNSAICSTALYPTHI